MEREYQYQIVERGEKPVDDGWRDHYQLAGRTNVDIWQRARDVSDYQAPVRIGVWAAEVPGGVFVPGLDDNTLTDEEVAMARARHEKRKLAYSLATCKKMSDDDHRAYHDHLIRCKQSCEMVVNMLLEKKEVSKSFLLDLLSKA